MMSKSSLDSKTRFYYLLSVAAMFAEITIIIGLFIAFIVLVMHVFV